MVRELMWELNGNDTLLGSFYFIFNTKKIYIDYTRVRPTFVCLFFYQLLARNKTKQASPEKKKKEEV